MRLEHTETVETGFPKSSFTGKNGAKKVTYNVRKDTINLEGSGCGEFESPKSDRTRQFSLQKLTDIIETLVYYNSPSYIIPITP